MRVLAALGLCACSFSHGMMPGDGSPSDTPRIDAPGDGPGDGPGDAPPLPDAPPGSTCYGPSSSFRVCLTQLPAQPFNVNSFSTYNTSQCTGGFTMTQPSGLEWCVVPATAIDISGQLTVSGPRPLVLLSTGGMNIGGLLLVAAGSNPAQCAAAGVGRGNTAGAGGGAGGSFGTTGGAGGSGFSGAAAGGLAAAATPQPVDILRGGCDGGAGGFSSDGGATNGGLGGGAVYLLAAGSLSIGGIVDVSGKGGGGGPVMKGGGGGGGSGGMIAIWAMAFASGGKIVGNGGAGGEGADNNDTGNTGGDGNPNNPLSPAQCVDGNSQGGVGGAGAAGLTGATGGQPSGVGGGGGGGAHGVIRILSGQLPTGAIFSPVPSLN